MLESLIHIDQQIFDSINQGLANPFFDKLMPIIREKKTWIPLYVGLGTWLVFKKKKEGLLIVAFAGLSVGLSDLISSHLLKDLFARTRPCLLEGFQEHVHLVINKCSGAYSFPSSHAANHMALAVFLSLTAFTKQKIWQILFVFWALLIGFAQIYVGVHFPLDVLGGFFVGVVCGIINYVIFRKLKEVVLK